VAFAQCDEVRDSKDTVRRNVVGLKPIVLQQLDEEVTGRKRESSFDQCFSDDTFAFFQSCNWLLRHEALGIRLKEALILQIK